MDIPEAYELLFYGWFIISHWNTIFFSLFHLLTLVCFLLILLFICGVLKVKTISKSDDCYYYSEFVMHCTIISV